MHFDDGMARNGQIKHDVTQVEAVSCNLTGQDVV